MLPGSKDTSGLKFMIKTILENLDFPEGPAVDSKGNIWLVELRGGNVVRLGTDGAVRRFPVAGGKPNGLAVDADDKIWFCDAGNDCISILDPDSCKIEVFCDSLNGAPLAHPNDLAFDREGNLLFTCPGDSRQKATGYVCAATKGGVVKKVIAEKFFPNGLAFAADGNTLVLAETYKKRLWKGFWDPCALTWSRPEPWADIGGKIGPDGMAFGDDGNLYVAVFGGGAIKVISPNGLAIADIPLDGDNPSNCAFNNAGGLLITETENGRLLSADIGVKQAGMFRR